MFAQIAHFYHVPSNCAILSCSIKLRNFFHVRSNCAINPTLKVHDHGRINPARLCNKYSLTRWQIQPQDDQYSLTRWQIQPDKMTNTAWQDDKYSLTRWQIQPGKMTNTAWQDDKYSLTRWPIQPGKMTNTAWQDDKYSLTRWQRMFNVELHRYISFSSKLGSLVKFVYFESL